MSYVSQLYSYRKVSKGKENLKKIITKMHFQKCTVFIDKKNLGISGSTQFEPMFEGELPHYMFEGRPSSKLIGSWVTREYGQLGNGSEVEAK